MKHLDYGDKKKNMVPSPSFFLSLSFSNLPASLFPLLPLSLTISIMLLSTFKCTMPTHKTQAAIDRDRGQQHYAKSICIMYTDGQTLGADDVCNGSDRSSVLILDREPDAPTPWNSNYVPSTQTTLRCRLNQCTCTMDIQIADLF